MNNEAAFRPISLDEYHRRHDDTANRITLDQLEPGLFVEAFSRSRSLERTKDTAVTFSAQIDHLSTPRAHAAGRAGFRLVIFNGSSLVKTTIERFAEAYPEAGTQTDTPLQWVFTSSYPLRYPGLDAVRQGFFSQFANSDDIRFNI